MHDAWGISPRRAIQTQKRTRELGQPPAFSLWLPAWRLESVRSEDRMRAYKSSDALLRLEDYYFRPFRGLMERLFPSRIKRLADQICRVGAGTRAEFLGAPVAHFRNIQIAFLVYAHAVSIPHGSRLVALSAPGVDQMTVEVISGNFPGLIVRQPKFAVRGHKEKLWI